MICIVYCVFFFGLCVVRAATDTSMMLCRILLYWLHIMNTQSSYGTHTHRDNTCYERRKE